ncbi:ankyrin repeat domain-containing protein [Wolbachia endosymbiont (group A) of Longitarsus flavicornis]|uniref:ankyrin repeat domain-containing protein n=1 Tax=Wolbachia endosymbiont (group A) of Longitarsus flavicornis TaxID=3066134 RepID=UPI0030CA1AE0
MFLKEERYNIQQAKGSNSGVFKQTVSQSKLIRKRRYGSKEADLLYFIRGCRDCQGSNLENLIKKIKELIENEGVSINYQDGDGDTFLHAAIVENIPDVASLLLDNGINVNIRNNKGETPLQLAIKEHSSDSQWDAGIKRLEELSKADQNKGLLSPDGQQALENSSSEFISKRQTDEICQTRKKLPI